MEKRIPVSTLEDLETLDDAEIIDGYHDGFTGEPEPGGNRSRAYWHGWRNGARDKGHIEGDDAMAQLAYDYVNRPRRPTTTQQEE